MLRNYGNNRPGQKNHKIQLDKHGQQSEVIETKKKTQNGLQSQCLAPQWRHPCRMSYPELEVGEASCKAYGRS